LLLADIVPWRETCSAHWDCEHLRTCIYRLCCRLLWTRHWQHSKRKFLLAG